MVEPLSTPRCFLCQNENIDEMRLLEPPVYACYKHMPVVDLTQKYEGTYEI